MDPGVIDFWLSLTRKKRPGKCVRDRGNVQRLNGAGKRKVWRKGNGRRDKVEQGMYG